MTVKIGFPSVLQQGVYYEIQAGTPGPFIRAEDFFFNLTGGAILGQLSGSGAFDVALDLGDSVAESIDYLYIRRADLLDGSVVTTFNISGGNTSISSGYTTIESEILPFGNLGGPRDEDVIAILTPTTAYRYFRIQLGGPAAGRFRSGLISAGTGFDMGTEPVFEWEREARDRQESAVGNGDLIRQRTQDRRYTFTLTWDFITDAKVSEFMDTIASANLRDTMILYTTANHQILDNVLALPVRLLRAETDNASGKADRNTVIAEFEEIVE
jgi:hypothetical protein